ncbi:unnamed protein product [Ectocarpus sp. CCAP 1310/34]|nr:unnamed protein product [Ectocarpus sp. CCAP 1310/34]
MRRIKDVIGEEANVDVAGVCDSVVEEERSDDGNTDYGRGGGSMGDDEQVPRVEALIQTLEHLTPDEVCSFLDDLMVSRSSEGFVCPEDSPATGYDLGLVWQETDDGGGDMVQKACCVRQGVEQLKQNAERAGKSSPEMEHLAQYSFFVKKAVDPWYVCVLEKLSLMPQREFKLLFKKALEDEEDPSYDDYRKMSVILEDDILHGLICGPMKKVMEEIGSEGGREVDMNNLYDWGEDVGFSLIPVGPKGGAVDLYPESFDGWEGSKKIPSWYIQKPWGIFKWLWKPYPVRITLEPGEMVCFTGVTRHRGVSYPFQCLRFFMSWVVKDAAVKAEKEGEGASTNNLELEGFPETRAIPFEQWKQMTA